MKQKFREIHLSKSNLNRLILINSIITEYQKSNYILTLRQLYYQLVTRDIIPNQQKEYSKLSTLLKEGRMGGIVDWSAIEDRLRIPYSPASWDKPSDILNSAISQYELPRQKDQENYIEVWVEKDALSGVLKRVTKEYHIPIMVNRGYSSVSAMYDAYNRFQSAINKDQSVKILYLGDFDPSGQDMIRDIKDRIIEFFDYEADFEIYPIALTKEQIKQYNPPPNPAKITDPRANKYILEHGNTSWEVDALKPEVLDKLLRDNIESYIDIDVFNHIKSLEQKDKDKLSSLKVYLS